MAPKRRPIAIQFGPAYDEALDPDWDSENLSSDSDQTSDHSSDEEEDFFFQLQDHTWNKLPEQAVDAKPAAPARPVKRVSIDSPAIPARPVKRASIDDHRQKATRFQKIQHIVIWWIFPVLFLFWTHIMFAESGYQHGYEMRGVYDDFARNWDGSRSTFGSNLPTLEHR